MTVLSENRTLEHEDKICKMNLMAAQQCGAVQTVFYDEHFFCSSLSHIMLTHFRSCFIRTSVEPAHMINYQKKSGLISRGRGGGRGGSHTEPSVYSLPLKPMLCETFHIYCILKKTKRRTLSEGVDKNLGQGCCQCSLLIHQHL